MHPADLDQEATIAQILQNNNPRQALAELLRQKEVVISNLSQQITRYKCEEVQNQKLIKGLQEKINLIAPSNSNTGSSFMMASEFRAEFEQFMTSTLPTALASLTDRPTLFTKCVADIFHLCYSCVESKLNEITRAICIILNIQEQGSGQTESRVRLTLMKVLQECWQKILPFDSEQILEYTGCPCEQIDELNEIMSGDDFITMRKHLHRLVVYMILQDKPWQFAQSKQRQSVVYNKKQYVCVDGWIKEGAKAVLVLGGLTKDGHMHPNLKNYVLPSQQDESPLPSLTLTIKSQTQLIKQQNTQKLLQQSAKQPTNFPESLFVSNNASSRQMLHENKQNCPPPLNRKPKKKEKMKASLDASNSADQEPKSKTHKQPFPNDHHRRKCEDIQILQKDRTSLYVSDICPKTGFIAVNNFIAEKTSDEFIKQRKCLEDLPVNREFGLKKKSKAQTSRKASAGKIVSQHHMLNHADERQKDSRPKAKERIYKQLIKQKLMEEKLPEKEKGPLKVKQNKQKRKEETRNSKEENRPLKLQSNVHRLREKYIY